MGDQQGNVQHLVYVMINLIQAETQKLKSKVQSYTSLI